MPHNSHTTFCPRAAAMERDLFKAFFYDAEPNDGLPDPAQPGAAPAAFPACLEG